MRRAPLLLAVLVLPLAATTSAGAATPATTRAVPSHCSGGGATAFASGTIWLGAHCGTGSTGGVTAATATAAGAFRVSRVAFPGYQVLDAADDGSTTFFLLTCTSGDKPEDDGGKCEQADPLGFNYAVAKLPHGGRPSAVTGLGQGAEVCGARAGSIVASGGRWRAVYGVCTGGRPDDPPATFSLGQAGTLPGAKGPAPHSDGGYDYAPSLALAGTTTVLAWVTAQPNDQGQPANPGTLEVSRAGADGTFTTTPLAQAAGADAEGPSVTLAGGTAVIAWKRAGRPALAVGDQPRVDLPSRSTQLGLAVAASGGAAYVVSEQSFAYAGDRTRRVYVQRVVGRTVRTTELSAAAGREDPHVEWFLDDVVAARGLATTFVDTPTGELAVRTG